MSEIVAVVTTVARREDAERIARTAVEGRLAACVQVSAIDSVYAWKGRVEHEAEFRVVCKTTRARHASLRQFILATHPYELPAVLTVEIAEANPAYEAWVAEGTTPPG